MKSLFSPSALARRSATHPWLTLGIWAVLLVVAVAGASMLKFDETQVITGSDSTQAKDLLQDMRGQEPVTETIVVQSSTTTVDDAAYRDYVGKLENDVRGLTAVTSVSSYLDGNQASLVSADRHNTILPVGISGKEVDAPTTVGPLVSLLKERSGGAFTADTVGIGSIGKAEQDTVASDLAKGEMIGIPIALVVLVVVFGAAVAAGVPVVMAMLGIFLAVGITGFVSTVLGVNSLAENMITMVGLAVGIDYTLFIVERFREERSLGLERVDAIVAAGNTASRAVLFSGISVAIALSGMLIVPATTFQGLAIGAIAVVISAIFVALTLLPAVLGLLGDRVNWLSLPGRKRRSNPETSGGFFAHVANIVQKHPIPAAVVSVAILLAAAAPYALINLGSPGVSDAPHNLSPVKAFMVLDRDFSAGRIAPTHVVIDGNANTTAVSVAVNNLRQRIANDPEFSSVGDIEISGDGQMGTFDVLLRGDNQSETAQQAVRDLRDDYIPSAFAGVKTHVLVGGATAETVDYIDTMNTYLPIVIGFVLALSFVLLLVAFRSIVLPLKAIVMNLLSVGAAYGLMVLVFQEGVGADLVGFQTSDTIAAFIPIFLFAVLFGLSMDYHVFLLSRIQERYLHTGDNKEAVSYGVRSTAHIITGAAAIMIAVFAGFASGRMVALQQTGFGLAVAVFLDATIVRSVLVPATMQLLGKWNWYLPSWLEWMPKISVEGPVPAPQAPAYGPARQGDYVPAGAK